MHQSGNVTRCSACENSPKMMLRDICFSKFVFFVVGAFLAIVVYSVIINEIWSRSGII